MRVNRGKMVDKNMHLATNEAMTHIKKVDIEEDKLSEINRNKGLGLSFRNYRNLQ